MLILASILILRHVNFGGYTTQDQHLCIYFLNIVLYFTGQLLVQTPTLYSKLDQIETRPNCQTTRVVWQFLA